QNGEVPRKRGFRKLPENWARSAFHAVATSVGDKSPSIKSSRFMLETCFGLLAIVERSATCPESRLFVQVKSHPLESVNTTAFELSRCAADAAAWAMIEVTASGQNPSWSLYWAGHDPHHSGTYMRLRCSHANTL